MNRYLLIATAAGLVAVGGCSAGGGAAAASPSSMSSAQATTSAAPTTAAVEKTVVTLMCDIPGKQIEVSDATDFPAAWALKPTSCTAARNGEIIANNFVGGAKRVQVTIRSGDYSFTSRGCGQWRKVG